MNRDLAQVPLRRNLLQQKHLGYNNDGMVFIHTRYICIAKEF